MELFNNSIELVDNTNGKVIHVNVSEKTEKLYKDLFASIQNKDEDITPKLNTFLLNFHDDIGRNYYFQGSINGPIIKSCRVF